MTINNRKPWNWLNGLTNKNKPVGIKKVIKHTMPSYATSYVYKLSSKKLNKTYIGYHKENGKIYFGSPTDQELIALLSDPSSDLILEVLQYGSKLEMMQLEHEMLKEVDAINNPNYWNKSNGQPGVPKFNRKAINKIVKIARGGGGKYLSQPMSVVDLSELPKAQVRTEEYNKDNLNEIIDAIKRAGGSTDKANPPIILEDRIYDGKFNKYLRIGGAHTIEAYCRTQFKKTTKLAPIVIPKELHKDITDDGITLLGDLLNAKRSIDAPATYLDGAKYLLTIRQSGRTWKSPEVRQDLHDMGLSSSSVKTAYDVAQAEVDNETMVSAGYVVKDYTSKKDKPELEKRIKAIQKHEPNTFVGSSSSAAITWDRIFDKFDKNKTDNQTSIKWLVYHPSKARQDNHWPGLEEKLLHLNRTYGKVSLSFEQLPLYKKEVQKN